MNILPLVRINLKSEESMFSKLTFEPFFPVGSPESFLTLNGGNYPKKETYSIVHNDTPLHYLYKSMWRRQPAQAVVDLLLKHGANMAARNHNGVSVEEVAKASARASEHDDGDE
jgi:hypothetical protein